MEKRERGLVLIVEDEPDLLGVIHEELSALGYEVLIARDGQEGFDLIQQRRPHAVVTDINMPKLSGLELVQKLRNQGEETPCIIMTAFYDKSKMLAALRLGVVDFIEKPFDFKYLIEAVSRAISLGIDMRNFESSLEEAFKYENIPSEKWEHFKRSKLAKMILSRGLDKSVRKKSG